jgi:hypothetical protein
MGAVPIIVAGTAQDEINPAVAVTNFNPTSGFQEIHVVYQCWNPAGGGQWDICHMWTPIPAIAWVGPVVLDVVPANDAIHPAVVYSDDLATQTGVMGMLVQIVWSEWNPGPPGIYEIQYDAYYYDAVLVPVRGYVGPAIIRGIANGATLDCYNPEIASADDVWNAGGTNFHFAIVWEESRWTGVRFQGVVWYADGNTITSPAPISVTLASSGQLSPLNNNGDCYAPDIAITQDYVPGGGFYYFHVIWVYNIWAVPTWQIDSCYSAGLLPVPGILSYIMTAPAKGPVNFALDNPTIASKVVQLGPTIFETWMAWEDIDPAGPSPTDIWYCVGQYNTVVPPFGYIFGPAFVPYAQPMLTSTEFNPELWNRDDSTRVMPPLTHLVFDMTSLTGVQEIEYIDP